MIARMLRLLLLALVVGLAAAAPSWADSGAEIGIEDGGVLLGPSPDAPQVVARWKQLGVDWVRIQAFWNAVSPTPTSQRAPAGFRIDNPNDPRYSWTTLDNAVNLVRSNGMRVMLTVHQTGPVWASQEPRRRNGAWKPDPVKYGQFAAAVAKRYGGRVDRYLVGNEPNQKVFLAPQTQCRRAGRRRVCERTGPSIYRNLANAAYPQLKRYDRSAQVLIGELAPIGASGPTAASLAPLPFLKGIGCLDDRFKKVRTGSCRRFRAPRGDAFGYHPYQIHERPDQVTRNKNLVKLGDLKRLFGVMDRLTRARRLIAPGRRYNLYITEYGYETNPPDRRFGVSLSTQSRFLQQSGYIVYSTPRVKLVTQYLWRDDRLSPSGRLTGFQTGLLFSNDTAKPSLATFPNPFFVDTRRGRARAVFWGQARPGGSHAVTLQVRRRGAPAFSTFRQLSTSSLGYFRLSAAATRGAQYRYLYDGGMSDVVGVP